MHTVPESFTATHTITGTGKLEKTASFLHVWLTTFLGSTSFFLVKGIRLSVWKTKDISIGGNNVTNVNFANIGDQVKFVETLK